MGNTRTGTLHDIGTALFCAEFGLTDDIPTYSGGLGTLTGDMAKTAADLGMRLAIVTLLYPSGYANQYGASQPWTPEKSGLKRLNDIVELEFNGNKPKVGTYFLNFTSRLSGHSVPIFFLTTDVEGNSEWERSITDRLYDNSRRFAQFSVLGIGGVRMLQRLGMKEVSTYHMNEGHSSLLTSELYRQLNENLDAVTERCIFTNHSIALSAMPMLSVDEINANLGGFVPEEIKRIAGSPHSTNAVAAALSRYRNGVSLQHSLILNEIFSGMKFGYITNGVHHDWVSERIASVLDRNIRTDWRIHPELLARASTISGAELWKAHMLDKADAARELNELYKASLDPEVFTIVFAKRATGYKRVDLVLNEEQYRLLESLPYKFQYLLAGKPHPDDCQSRDNLNKAVEIGSRLSKGRVVFIPDYSIDVAKRLLRIADVWLNNPLSGLEASGTSGMKAALNGIPSISNLEGWLYEAGIINGMTGWVFRRNGLDEAVNVVGMLKAAQESYHGGRMGNMMSQIISQLGPRFNSPRMMRQYGAVYGHSASVQPVLS